MAMSGVTWYRRFFDSTRGRIVELLRPASRTVDELAGELGLTDNAVRSHLATLERDGLVQQRGQRRGDGKPAHLYELTSEGERLFPKAYGPVLRELLDVLGERLSETDLRAVLREVGRRVAAEYPRPPNGDPRLRVERAASLLSELGGLTEVEAYEGGLRIRGYSCPLAAILPGHPEACELATSVVAEATGYPVTEQCDKGQPPRCWFEISPLPVGGPSG
jgi:predicted ArsR family transcriptional regulator